LKDFVKGHPESIRVQLTLAQLSLVKGDIPAAISALESITSLKNRPAMVATLVSLYEQSHRVDVAIKIFDDYVGLLESSNEKDNETYIKILKENGNFKLKHKRDREAATAFEKVLLLNKNDLEALPGAIIAYSSFDIALAEKYSNRIPQLVGQKELNVDQLENIGVRVNIKTSKQEVVDPKKKDAPKEKKKRNKKKRLPKDLTKPVDPERWIPLKQRSTFKRKRKNKMDKGSQGGAAVGRSVQQEKGKATEKATDKTQQTTVEKNEKEEKEEKPKPQTTTQHSKKKSQKKRR